MVKWLSSRALWGVLLILAGILFLTETLGLIRFDQALWSIFWVVAFGLGGLLFLGVYLQDRNQWWAIIPGFTLLGLSGTVLLGVVLHGTSWSGALTGAFFLGMIGLGFLVIYLLDHEKWWAIIPAGVLATLAVITGLAAWLPGALSAGVLFFGLALTFALLAVLPNPHGSMQWAWVPAAVLFVVGLVVLSIFGPYLNYVWALGLIAAGGFLLLRSLRSRAG